MGVIYFVSAQPSLPRAPEPLLDLLLKKGGHLLAYGVLAWLYLRALAGEANPSDRLRLISLALAVAYAASDEFHQSFVPGRGPSLVDVFIDSLGAMLALLLERWTHSRSAAR
jgi:VanZ family protein